MEDKIIKVDYLARVEGEGALHVKIKNNAVEQAQLKIFEPPRFFEAFLEGRNYAEAPDITARICGICPVAYQMSSTHALEKALKIEISPEVRALRRLLYCGEWIESHVLHMYFLHAPDFLGLDDALQIAKKDPQLVKAALKLKKAGNDIVRLIGGREIHPINVRVGGFYKVFEKNELSGLRQNLEEVKEIAYNTLKVFSAFAFPGYEQDYLCVSLRHEREYPMNEGRLVTNRSQVIEQDDYESYFEESQAPYSTTLHTVLNKDGQNPFLTGPIARYNNNFDKLPEHLRQKALESGLGETCRNPFKSILVRAVETIYALEEAIHILDHYKKPEEPYAGANLENSGQDEIREALKSGKASGCAITEAPRGILYHHYTLDARGLIQKAKIVAPTSHNQKIMEYDLFHVVTKNMDLENEKLARLCEDAIRNYDPCISCSTHFLRLNIER